MHRHDARFPVEDRGFAAVRAAALDVEFERLQAGRRDEAAALKLALAAQDQRGQAARLADRRDPVLVVRVLEPVDGLADEESARAVVHVVREVDARAAGPVR